MTNQVTKIMKHEENIKNQDTKIKYQEEKMKNQDEKMKNQHIMITKQEEKIKTQDAKIKDQDHKTKDQDEKIIRQEEEIKQLKTASTTLQKNVQHLSNNSSHVFTDTYIWRVNQLRKKMDRAKADRLCENPLIRSFYTSRGHKLETELYLNGFGEDINKYISVYFIAKEGLFDDIANWPMKAIIKSYVNDDFVYEINTTESRSVAFQKPANKTSFGYGDFISLDNIFNVAQNNSLFLKISVTYL